MEIILKSEINVFLSYFYSLIFHLYRLLSKTGLLAVKYESESRKFA